MGPRHPLLVYWSASVNNISQFIYEVMATDSFVWTIALFMSVCSGYVLHNYIEDYFIATWSSLVMLSAIIVGNAAFAHLGVFFTTNEGSNVIVASGAAVCSITLMSLILLRIWNAIMAYQHVLRGEG